MNTAEPFKRSQCAIANSLDIVGDKWSLLVVRDLLHGKRTYGDLANSLERIPTNILAERLKRLQAAGIVVGTAYQQHPLRSAYALTPKGKALGDVLLEFVRWGKQHIPGTLAIKHAPTRATSATSTAGKRRIRARRE